MVMATRRPRLKKRCVDFVPSLLDTRHNLLGSRSLSPVPLPHVLLPFSSLSLYPLVTSGLIIPLPLDSPLCRMSWCSTHPIRQSSSSQMQHFLERQSDHPTQASVSMQGAAAQAKVTLMLGSSWLPSSPPPRHRPPHHQWAQFPWLRWYSSRVRSSASRGHHPSFLRMHTRPLLVSCRLAGTLRSQLRRDAKTRVQLTVIISDRVQVITF